MKLPFGTNVLHKTQFLGKDVGDFNIISLSETALKCLNEEHENINNMEAFNLRGKYCWHLFCYETRPWGQTTWSYETELRRK